MLVSYNWLQEYITGKLPSAEKLGELLSLHVFEVEGIEKKGKDWILNIDILPHRSDAISHRDIATEVAAVLKKKVKEKKTKGLKTQKGTLPTLKVSMDSSLVQRYHAVVIEGVKVQESPKWIRDRLEALGINAINNLVDITNLVMLETGQPLHVFDYDTIRDHKMDIRASKKGEKFVSLDGVMLTLPANAIVIEDKERLIDLAGIKGGKVSGVSQKTKNLIFQAATFNPKAIYMAKKAVNLTTPAADLYAAGISPDKAGFALERAVELLKETTKGKIVQVIDQYPKKQKEVSVIVSVSKVQKVLGVEIPSKEMQAILERLGFKVSANTKKLKVTVPLRRLDISIEEDVIEEIGRIYGYENIKPTMPIISLTPPVRNEYLYWQDMLRDSMRETGFFELYTHAFISKDDLRTFIFTPEEAKRLIEIANPISEEYQYLRSSLLENLLKNVVDNKKNIDGEFKVFEIGNIFEKLNDSYTEHRMLSGVIALPKESIEEPFYVAKGIVDFLLQRLGLTDVWYDNFEQTPDQGRSSLWHTNKTAEIKEGDREIGFVGEISPQVISNLKLTQKIAAFSIDISQLLKTVSDDIVYQATAKFPAVLRDVAVLVPNRVQIVDVMNVIHAAGTAIISDIDVFDIYMEADDQGRKNLAFHIVFQSTERTLTGREVDTLQQKIIEALQLHPNWEVRK